MDFHLTVVKTISEDSHNQNHYIYHYQYKRTYRYYYYYCYYYENIEIELSTAMSYDTRQPTKFLYLHFINLISLELFLSKIHSLDLIIQYWVDSQVYLAFRWTNCYFASYVF